MKFSIKKQLNSYFLNSIGSIRQNSSIKEPYQHVEHKNYKETDYESLELIFGQISDQEIIKKVGEGKYSEVFQALDLFSDQKVILKILKQSENRYSFRMKRECFILDTIKELPDVIQIRDIILCPFTNNYTIVYENQFEDQPFLHYYRNIESTKAETLRLKLYMLKIVTALANVHQHNIVHRDIKPTNILVSDEDPTYVKVIDWGMAETQHPGKVFNLRVASRNFKAPELLLGNKHQHYGLDVWGCGAMFAGIIFGRDPFFEGKTNLDIVRRHVELFGSKRVIEQLHKQNLMEQVGQSELNFVFEDNEPGMSLIQFYLRDEGGELPEDIPFREDSAVDLLDKMLQLDQQDRVGLRELVEHEFFRDVRNL